MANDLLPCPFCGGEPAYYDCAPKNAAGVNCTVCGADRESVEGDDRAQTRDRWNTRFTARRAPPGRGREEIARYLSPFTWKHADKARAQGAAEHADKVTAHSLSRADVILALLGGGWQSIETLPDELPEYMMFWNPCDGPHLMRRLHDHEEIRNAAFERPQIYSHWKPYETAQPTTSQATHLPGGDDEAH